jgi:DNA-binding MarR family transcriptional regulator
MVPGVLVIMLAGIIFPFITADSEKGPEKLLPTPSGLIENTDIITLSGLSHEDYANNENTISRDMDSLNLSNKAAAAFGFLPWLIPLYSKLSPDAVLSNTSRAQLYNMVCSQPGITFGTLARMLNIAPGTAEYHLRILEREGYLRSRKCGKFLRYYPWQMSTSPYTPLQQKILNSLAIEPDQSQTGLAEKVGVSKQVVNYNIKQLREFGVLEEHKLGTKILCRLNAESPYSPHAF